jgi:hypothetical protein
VDPLDLLGDVADHLEVDAVVLLAAQRFAAELQQDAAPPRPTIPIEQF